MELRLPKHLGLLCLLLGAYFAKPAQAGVAVYSDGEVPPSTR